MKKLLTTLLSVIMIATAMTAFVGCQSGNNPDDGEKPAATVKKANVASVNIDINPSVELIVGEDGLVLSVRGANDDGLVILSIANSLEGKTIEQATEEIITLAKNLGFFEDGKGVIGTMVNSDNEELLNLIKQKVSSSVSATAQKTGLSLKTDLEGAFSLVRRLEDLKTRFPDNEAIKSLDINKLRLAVSVSETCDISLEAAVELDETRLLQMLSDADKKIESYATEAFRAAKSKALAAYDKVAAIETYAVYTKFYAEHASSRILKSYYGAAYQLYASAKAGFSALLDVSDISTQIAEYELDEQKVAKIAEIFGMTDLAPLKDANGKITVKSVEAYADKLFRNSEASELLESKKQALATALNTAEAQIRTEVDKLADEYKSQINAQISQTETIYNTVKPTFEEIKTKLEALSFIPGLNEAVADLSEILKDFEEITAKVKELLNDRNATIKVSEFEKIVSEYSEKAATYLEKIEADLTDAEKAELQAKIDEINQKHAKEKAELDKALSDAETAAKEYLAAKKQEFEDRVSGTIETPDGGDTPVDGGDTPVDGGDTPVDGGDTIEGEAA